MGPGVDTTVEQVARESAMGGGLLPDLEARLTAFVAARVVAVAEIDPSLEHLVAAAGEAVTGGKRIRAALCHWAWRAAGRDDSDVVLDAGGALELFHAGALVHDDVMDRSDDRRGRPSVHRRFATHFRAAGLVGDPDRFGDSAAVLLGDLLMGWSAEMLEGCGAEPERLREARAVLDLMRAQAIGGQYLDLWEQAQRRIRYAESATVVLYKSAKYSAEQPLVLGARLAGASESLVANLATFGREVGEAFQLRDDVLGVFGDPDLTGKPVGDDLRERKKTVLVALAHERGTAAQRDVLERGLLHDDTGDSGASGAPDVDALRETIVATGALDELERRVRDLLDDALARLDSLRLDPVPHEALRALAVAAAHREA